MKLVQRVLLMLVIACLLCGPGCTEKQKQDYSHWKSDVIGLHRTVILYDANGKAIKTWKGRFKVEQEGTSARFIANGKTVIISGTFVIEED